MATSEREIPRHETVMDVTEEQIARVYAKAFLGVVGKQANVGDLVAEVAAILHELLDKFPNLEATLRSGLLSHEHKERILDRVFGPLVATDVLNFLKVLTRHDRLNLLRSVVLLIQKQYAEQCGQAEVEVRIARELDEALWADILERLRKGLGKEPILKVIVDPSLIAGIVVRAGDRVFDGSVRTQLDNARKAMIARAVDLIETQPEKFLQSAS